VAGDHNSDATKKVWIILKSFSLIEAVGKEEERQKEDPWGGGGGEGEEETRRDERPVKVRDTTMKDMTLATFQSGIGFQGSTPSVSVIGSPYSKIARVNIAMTET
jgi:hypothetical protein